MRKYNVILTIRQAAAGFGHATLAVFLCAALFVGTAMAETVLRVSHGLGRGGAETMDAHSVDAFYIMNQLVHERLTRTDETGAATPYLATSWSISDDGLALTMQLREGVTFHDGSDFDAADVVYSISRILDPELDSPNRSTIKSVDSIEALGSHTVRFNLNQPDADLSIALTEWKMVMIPEGSGDTMATSGIGTGPFLMSRLDPEGTSEVVVNENYWGQRAGVDRVEVIAIPDSEARIQALLTGQIDYIEALTAQQKPMFENNSRFKMQTIPTGEWKAIIFLVDRPPFDDPRVRKAVRIVVDRQEMTDLVAGPGSGTIACDHPVWAGDAYQADIDCPQDIAEAQRLLAEAGFPDGIEFNLYTSDKDPHWSTMAEVYQEQAADAGIKVNIVVAPADGYWTDVYKVETVFQTWWWQRSAGVILNLAWRSDSSWNENNWNSAEFDAKLDAAAGEPDFEKRKALYGELQRQLYEEGSSLIPFHFNITRAYVANVDGFQPIEEASLRWELITKSE
jgi:peptide/nickel transport system substrate-binding protein